MGQTRASSGGIAVLVALAILASSCSGDRTAGPTPSPSPPTESTPPPTAREVLLDKIDRATDREGVELTTSTLPDQPPPGYSRSAVASLASRVLQVAERSADPRLSRLNPRRAYGYVFEGQFPETRRLASVSGENLADDVDWEGLYVDRFDRPVADPTYLIARWEVRPDVLRFDDGTFEPTLDVQLETMARFDVTADQGTVPVVVKRILTLTDYKYPTGSDPTAAIEIDYSPLFSDWCGFTNGAVLRPSGELGNLRRDLRFYRALVAAADDGGTMSGIAEKDNEAALARCETQS